MTVVYVTPACSRAPTASASIQTGEHLALLRELRVPRRYTLYVVGGAARRRTAAQRLKVGVGEVEEVNRAHRRVIPVAQLTLALRLQPQ